MRIFFFKECFKMNKKWSEIKSKLEHINKLVDDMNKEANPKFKTDKTEFDNYLQKKVFEHQNIISAINRDHILNCAFHLIQAFQSGNKIMICGNGGSAADAQHIAAELVVKFKKLRKALPAIALNTDTSILTACGNDFSFDDIFARQIEALGNYGDVLIAISTSGKSRNILRALEAAAYKNMITIGITGDNGFSSDYVEVEYRMHSDITARIQEAYMLFLHLVCDVIDITIVEENT